MATMNVTVKTYQPDDSTLRETYTEALGTKADEDMVIRGLTFRIGTGGLQDFSFIIWEDPASITTVVGDIVHVYDNGSVLRYKGVIESMEPDRSDTTQVYEARTRVSGQSLLGRADNINYSLRETDGSAVATNVQDILTDVFEGGNYTGKGQDNNVPIEDAFPLLTYAEGNNTLVSKSVSIAYNQVPAAEVVKDVIKINDGTLDLSSVEPYIYELKVDNSFNTAQRVTTLLYTFDVDDGDFPLKDSVDLADDGWRQEGDIQGIYNKFILNGAEITSLQYSTEVTVSRAAYGTRTAPPLENKNITVTEAQEWLDGFLLDMLGEKITHTLRLRKSKYGFAPIWFSGGSDTINGYIKLTEGGAGELVNAPFREATYTLDSGGWNVRIGCGDIRPSITERSRILTEFTGLGDITYTGGVTIGIPTDTPADGEFLGLQFSDWGFFSATWNSTTYPIVPQNVTFKVRTTGKLNFGSGSLVKTFTSSTQPTVTSTDNKTFECIWYRGTTPASKPGTTGGTYYPLGLTSGVYKVYVEFSINVDGVTHVVSSEEDADFFSVKAQTTNDKANDSFDRMPDAEKQNAVTYDPGAGDVAAEVRFFTDIGGDTPPDAGTAGWFITSDNITWTRMDGDFAGNLTGTTNASFQVDADASEASYIYLNFGGTAGTGGEGLRLDISGAEVQVNHGAGWVSLATGASDAISKTISSVVYRAEIDATTGNLEYTRDGVLKFSVTGADGVITTYDAVAPAVDDQDDLGDATHKYANAYIGNVTYTQDVIGSGDGGATEDWKIEWDGTNSEAFVTNVAFGFMD